MLHVLAFAASAAAAPSHQFRIVAASLFKNGYAVVTRALDVRNGTTIVSDIPNGALGTVWFQVTDGFKIKSIRNTFAPVSSYNKRSPMSISELLQLNIGKTVRLSLINDKAGVTGKLVSISGDLALVQTESGLRGFSPTVIASVTGSGLKKTTTDVDKTKKRVLKIDVAGKGAGRVYMMALEQGLSWSPAYSLDITNPESMKFAMKATLIDDLGDIKGIETRLVTGFPNLLYAGVQDPIFAQATLEQYLQSIGASDAQRNALRGGFANSAMTSQVLAFRSGRAPSGGGFGGGGMGGNADMAPVPMEPGDNLPGVQAEDLYFYRLTDVHMDLGDRSYYVLAAKNLPFKEVYTWTGTDPIVNNTSLGNENGVRQPRPPQDDQVEPVWHSLEFDNRVGLPLTTGPAVTVQSGEILGQDLLKYTSQGAKTTVRITKALDIEGESYDEETSREIEKMQYSNRWTYDLAHLKTTMRFTNHKNKAIHLRVTFHYTGQVEDNGGGTDVKERKGLRDVNPVGKLQWDRDLPAGETMVITFQTGVYVNGHFR